MEEDEGEGGKWEKSVVWTRRGWCVSPWLEEEELAEVWRDCFSLLRSPEVDVLLSLRRSLLLFSFGGVELGSPFPRLRCLRFVEEDFSSLSLERSPPPEGVRVCFLRMALASMSNSSEVRFFAGLRGETKVVWAEPTEYEAALPGVDGTGGAVEGLTVAERGCRG